MTEFRIVPLGLRKGNCLVGLLLSAALGAQTAQIHGTVVDHGGKPLAVRIDLLHAGSREQVMTSTGSAFTFDRVAAGRYDIRVYRYLFVSAFIKAIPIVDGARLELPPIRLDLISRCAEERDFALTPNDGAGIAGRVMDESHDPVPNAQVILFQNHSRTALGKTLADGSFSIRDLETGMYSIVVQAEGFYSENADRVRALSGYSSQLSSIELERCHDAQCSPALKTIKIEAGCDIPDL